MKKLKRSSNDCRITYLRLSILIPPQINFVVSILNFPRLFQPKHYTKVKLLALIY